MHRYRAATRSSSGCGGGPFLFFDDPVGLPCVSTDVDDALPSPCRSRDADLESDDVRGDDDRMCSEGSTSFFCFDAGRISSKSTGTPSETRNSLRVRERIQSGGARGGGATSCDHNEADRGVRNVDDSLGRTLGDGMSRSSGGNSVSRHGSVDARTSSGPSPSKSGMA